MTPLIISTHAKLFIKSWSTLNELIFQATRLPKPDSSESEVELKFAAHTSLLSDDHVQEALNGPYGQLIKLHLTAFAKISRLRFFLTIEQDDAFKNNLDQQLFPKQPLKNITIEELTDKQTQLDTLLKKQAPLWEAQMDLWANTLMTSLRTHDMALSDTKIQGSPADPISELWNRFSMLLNAPVKDLEKATGLYKYWYLKIYLSIQAAIPSETNTKSDAQIKKLMKLLKKDFRNLMSQEQALLESHAAEIQTIIDRMPL